MCLKKATVTWFSTTWVRAYNVISAFEALISPAPSLWPSPLTTGVKHYPNSHINHPLALLYGSVTFMRLPNNALPFAYTARFVLATQLFKTGSVISSMLNSVMFKFSQCGELWENAYYKSRPHTHTHTQNSDHKSMYRVLSDSISSLLKPTLF